MQEQEMTYDLSKIDDVLSLDGFVILICGKKDDGKTDFGLRICEYAYLMEFKDRIATNIKTENYMIECQITNLPDLKEWILQKGKKIFLLDEAGKHLKSRRSLSAKNVELLDIIQLLFHYDVGLICCYPASVLLDSGVKDTDMWDLWIKKKSKRTAIAKNNRTGKTIKFRNIPKTSIYYSRKDIAIFDLTKQVDLLALKPCCRVAKLYAESGTYEGIRKGMPELKDHKQIQRLMIEHCKHSASVTSDNT